VTDSEVDLVTGDRNDPEHPIPPENLRVFPSDADLPKDELNTAIDQHFVPIAQVEPPKDGEFDAWKKTLTDELRRVAFRAFPERIPAARVLGEPHQLDETGFPVIRIETEPGIHVPLRYNPRMKPQPRPERILLVVKNAGDEPGEPKWLSEFQEDRNGVLWIEPRGVGTTRWTTKNPPNYVARSHVLLGRTVDTGRVRDVIAAARALHEKHEDVPIHVAGRGNAALIAAYAALWAPEIAGAIIADPPKTHMAPDAPQFLNLLRVCDVPEMLGLLAPKSLTIHSDKQWDEVQAIYDAAGASEQLSIKSNSHGNHE
ncbi:MAG: hypothetical protein ACREIV_04465, partial [Planctomycetaceae bacterium]